jgi:type IX secretion system PorP/SprF family membrane protein
MIRKSIITRVSLVAALAFAIPVAHAQDIHFTQFDAVPLVINPAFTGDFDGQYRASVIYRNQWQSVTVPYVTYGAAFDMPIVHDLTIDDFLAAGVQVYKDQAGDGNLSNFTGMLSLAYHKFLGANNDKVLAVGLQGGYAENSIDLSKLYFGDEFANGTFNQGSSQEYHLGLGNSDHYYIVNAGVSFSQSTSEKFGYTLGIGADNLNQPDNALERTKNDEAGLAMCYTGEVGAIWYVDADNKFSLRPGLLYQSQASASEFIIGNEFHYTVGNPEFKNYSTAVFLGGWYRTGDAAMLTGGIEFKGFRIGLSYDYNVSALNTATNGNGGFEISLRYIAPNPLDFARRLVYPCSRF